MCCQRQCLDVLFPVEEVLTAGADDDYTRSHVWGIVRKLGMRDVKEESRVCRAVGLDKRARVVEISVAAGTRWSEASWTGADERCRGGRRGQRVWRLGLFCGGCSWWSGLAG
jgi:hypothetical protein